MPAVERVGKRVDPEHQKREHQRREQKKREPKTEPGEAEPEDDDGLPHIDVSV